MNAKEIFDELNECEKELNLYYDLQKIFTFDYIDYDRWIEQIKQRKTLFG